MVSTQTLSSDKVAKALAALRKKRPLVHCITNDVVQQITANVLLAAGASPAMVIGEDEVASFASIADCLLINTGTPTRIRAYAMKLAAAAAKKANKPWVLDPVAAGVSSWRNDLISQLLEIGPTVVRGNASEIMAIAGAGKGGKGVDSLNASSDALEAAVEIANRHHSVVCVTGQTDYITDGKKVFAVEGGHAMTTLVVGTGCALSGLMASFVAISPNPLLGATACCQYYKRVAERAYPLSEGPGSYHVNFIDSLYRLFPEDLEAQL